MKLSTQSHSLIESALKEAVSRFAMGCEQTVVTDIHLLPKQGSGELIIFDDDDEELARVIIEEWVDYDNDDFYENAIISAIPMHIAVGRETSKFNRLIVSGDPSR